jgi:hypothetical protein
MLNNKLTGVGIWNAVNMTLACLTPRCKKQVKATGVGHYVHTSQENDWQNLCQASKLSQHLLTLTYQ